MTVTLEAPAQFETANEVLNIPLALIDRDETQPREHFDPVALAELADSIKANGLQQPITVRPAADTGRFLIVMGERRWRAVQSIEDMDTIPAQIRTYANPEAILIAQAIENINRADMNPLEEARTCDRLLNGGPERTTAWVGEQLGKTARWVQVRLDLLQLSPELQQLVIDGKLNTGPAQKISQVSKPNQRMIELKILQGAFATDNELVHFAYAVAQGEKIPMLFGADDEVPYEEKQKRAENREKTTKSMDHVERLAEALKPLLKLTPNDVAGALGDRIPAMLEQTERCVEALVKYQFALRQGDAVYKAYELTVNPAAVADNPAEPVEVADLEDEPDFADEPEAAAEEVEAVQEDAAEDPAEESEAEQPQGSVEETAAAVVEAAESAEAAPEADQQDAEVQAPAKAARTRKSRARKAA